MIQAEIDAAAELIDFFRFNAKFAVELEGEQPISVPPSTNSVVYRGLEVPQVQGGRGLLEALNLASLPPLISRASWQPSPPLTSLRLAATWQGLQP